jgi:hypothetical protein
VGITISPIIFGGSALNVAMDNDGNAIVTWGTTTSILRSKRLPVGTNEWIEDSLISADLPEGLIDINAALSLNGRGFSIWQRVSNAEGTQALGAFTLAINPLPPTPPIGISGRSCNNKFASQTDRIHIISWLTSVDPTVTSYLIRRNGVIIATIPSQGFLIYYDHNRCKKTDIYTVTAVGENGLESSALTIELK